MISARSWIGGAGIRGPPRYLRSGASLPRRDRRPGLGPPPPPPPPPPTPPGAVAKKTHAPRPRGGWGPGRFGHSGGGPRPGWRGGFGPRPGGDGGRPPR